MPRRQISHYELLDRLGEGGMGVVYKARDLRLGRLVALKLLPPRLLESADARRRLEDEARAISSLNHPAIATIYETAEHEGTPVLVFEYLPGGTLRERMRAAPMPLAEILDHALQICAGLACAHRHGILHRDVKPENLMFTADGRLKITDFGLARFLDGRTETLEGSIRGTLTHIAPECLNGMQPGPRADIFSLGVVLYEMAAGRPPFTGATPAALLYAVAHAPPPPLGRPDLPDAFANVVLRALAKHPDERYASAGELAADLQRLPDHPIQPAPAPPAATPPRILVVEDEDDLRRGIEMNLTREGFSVLTASTGPDGARIAAAERPGLILLDVMLPGKNGLDVCRDLRAGGFTGPIVMLSARSEEIDRVVGLEIGASDYVTKPFSMRELIARIRAHLRASPSR